MAARRGALILAAGASQRMGTPKALLAWGGTTLLEYTVQQAHAALTDVMDVIVVVLGPATHHLAASLGDVRVAFNLEPKSGRSASLRIGCEAMPEDVLSVVVQSVDQPCPADVLSALFAAVEQRTKEVAVPSFQGRRGHPVCFAGSLWPELRRVTEEAQRLRAVVRRHVQHLVEVPVDSECVLWNLNDPAAYAAAQAHAG